ncbi:MAG: chloride channel protein [Bacillota bacterium]|nr:chloride channel protein [Bacillota bacterium]
MQIKFDSIEEHVLLGSAVKWIILSAVIGLIVGTVTALFVKIINISSAGFSKLPYYYLFMPFGFFLSSLLIKKFAPEAKGHGTEKAIKAINEKAGKMDIKAIPVKLIATLFTITAGGSVGLEGPATQIGGGIASFFAGLFKMSKTDCKRLVVCGVSAGFVGVFGSPVGAAVFASEVLYVGRFSYLALLPSLVSSFVSYNTGLRLGSKPLLYSVSYIPSNNVEAFISIAIFGIIVGALGKLFVMMVNNTEKFFNRIKLYSPLKGIIGGILIAAIVSVTPFKNTLGIGEKTIDMAVSGGAVLMLTFVFKAVFTSITLGCGGSGGILTPMLFIGACFGNSWAQIIHGNISFYSSIGMVSFLAACANTPLAGIVIAMELFGAKVGIYASIACAISYLLIGHSSIYPTQILLTSKSPSVICDTNCEVQNINSLKIINKYKKNKVI